MTRLLAQLALHAWIYGWILFIYPTVVGVTWHAAWGMAVCGEVTGLLAAVLWVAGERERL